MELTIAGKVYPCEFGMHALTDTIKDLGIKDMDFEALGQEVINSPITACESLVWNCLKNTARKERRELDITRDDVWDLFDSVDWVNNHMTTVMTEFFDSMKIGEQASETVESMQKASGGAAKKKTGK